MRCETFLERYEALDNAPRLGLRMRLHLSSCESCRTEVIRLERALEAYRSTRLPGARALEREGIVEDRIMTAVRLLPRPRRSVSLRDWILSGAVIALSMALIPLGEYFDAFKLIFGTSYALPLALVLGSVITAYGALFIGTHLEEIGGFLRRGEGAVHR